ncbi:hypothetical protein [Bradyrhizobium sp. STM 3809]|uniref:hypothetical protein n=1 Tax=Bradyrhizobium sp. STM 3809 TaxID=551936 RepID=UPI000309C06D|nr:hypothetical protein [Bradyrhizobium sp. STM 3809]
MNPARLAAFKETVGKLVQRAKLNEFPNAPAAYLGEKIAPTLEHNVRKTFIDQLLRALGWNLERAVAEEARLQAENTLFLDYLGVHLEERTPHLLFEAKAWEKPPPRAKSASDSSILADQLIAKSLDCLKAKRPEDAPILAEWTEWLQKLVDYVQTLKKQSGAIVGKFAISSGQWLVIFTDPVDAFIAANGVNARNILVLEIDHYVAQSDHIYGQLSHFQLSDHIPFPLRPSQITTYAPAKTIRHIFRALLVRWESSGSPTLLDTFPRILLYPAVVIERSDTKLLVFAEGSLGHSVVPVKVEDLSTHREEVQLSSERLYGELTSRLGQHQSVSPLTAFRGFPPIVLRGSVSSVVPKNTPDRPSYVKTIDERPSEFVIVTGEHTHFLLASSDFSHCPGHDWMACHAMGKQVRAPAILNSSVDPKSYFVSGSTHHCAHIEMHDLRAEKCFIEPFEAYLCCKACAFQSVCWSTSGSPLLPCTVAATSDAGESTDRLVP